MKRPHAQLARMLAAASIAYVLGYKSIDGVLRRHIPRHVPEFWHQEAERVWDHIVTAGPNWRDSAPR